MMMMMMTFSSPVRTARGIEEGYTQSPSTPLPFPPFALPQRPSSPMASSISQFFVLSQRGDTIISRDYRGDVVRGTAEIFFRKVKTFKGDVPPVFNVEGIHFLHIKKSGLFFVCTTRINASPALGIELLNRLYKLFKDYCGVMTEESVRKNFALIYELLDEAMDFGFPQSTSTEQMKAYVFNEPVVVDQTSTALAQLKLPDTKTTPSSSVHKPISIRGDRKGTQRNEIFVDILERLSITFNASGYVLNAEIDGSIQMKSYLMGNPELRLALNEDLVIGKTSGHVGYGVVALDDCNFHECARTDDFEMDRTILFYPPDGEFVLMNYRITGDFRIPFRVLPFVEEVSPTRIEAIVKIRADIPSQNYGSNVILKFPVPKNAASVSCDLGVGAMGESWEFKQHQRTVNWYIKKLHGGTEHTIRAKITLSQPSTGNIRKEMGPLSMSFEIPMYNCSALQVRFLRIMERSKSYHPFRWVRYLTLSSSYICRL